MKVYDSRYHCYGCNSCYSACPTKAITMQLGKEGFLYPTVNQNLCCGCQRCKEVCPIHHSPLQQAAFEQVIYAVKHKDEVIRSNSTSGGMFTALSDYILEMGGIVYGAILDDTLRVCHSRATTKEERDRMRGSKYVQSDIGDTFLDVKKDLEDGKQVLFTGTPCQVEGLKNYLKRTDTAQLILCDIICHGVPSNQIWQEYVRFTEKKQRSPLKYHNFRTKHNGWHSVTARNVFLNAEDSESLSSQLFSYLFQKDLILRPCCYSCRFSSLSRVSDITIGDFWGIDKIYPEFDDNKGVSLVLINTFRGNAVFQSIKEVLEVRESKKEDCLQHNLMRPTPLPENRGRFWRAYLSHGFLYATRKYAGYSRYNLLKHKLKEQIKELKIYPYVKRILHPDRRI